MRALAYGTRMHAAPLTGAVLHALDVPLSTAQRLTLFITARGVLSAGVRLGIVGPCEAQRLQHASGEQLETVARGCADLSIDDAAQFSRELADYTIYVIDVSGGDKIPRKGGPGITQSDLLVINKTDLASS